MLAKGVKIRFGTLLNPMVLACLFIAVTTVTAIVNLLPILVPVVYWVMSLVTFVVYAMDKSAARNRQARTAENTLHGLALLGGWPGAILAQEKLRHKSSKKKFRLVFWVTVLSNLILLYYVVTFIGRISFQ